MIGFFIKWGVSMKKTALILSIMFILIAFLTALCTVFIVFNRYLDKEVS